MNHVLNPGKILRTLFIIVVQNPLICAMIIAINFLLFLRVSSSYLFLLAHKPGFRPASKEFVNSLFEAIQANRALNSLLHIQGIDWVKFGLLIFLYALLFGLMLFIMVNVAGALFERRSAGSSLKENLGIFWRFLLVYFFIGFLFDDLYTIILSSFWESELISFLSIRLPWIIYAGVFLGLPLLMLILYFYLRWYAYAPCLILGKKFGVSSLACSWRKTRGNILSLIFTVLALRLILFAFLWVVKFIVLSLLGLLRIQAPFLLFSVIVGIGPLGSALYAWLSTLLAVYIYREC